MEMNVHKKHEKRIQEIQKVNKNKNKRENIKIKIQNTK
jgi:hypothetical protein